MIEAHSEYTLSGFSGPVVALADGMSYVRCLTDGRASDQVVVKDIDEIASTEGASRGRATTHVQRGGNLIPGCPRGRVTRSATCERASGVGVGS